MEETNWGKSKVAFIPGLELSELFYREAVRPVLMQFAPGLPHTAALVGYGSEVLGFDTPMSRDHMWGPRLVLFLPEAGFEESRARVDESLRRHLPVSFHGYPANFGDPDQESVRRMEAVQRGPVNHLVHIYTLRGFVQAELGFDILREPEPLDWLVFSEQALLEITAGGAFHDDLGLEAIRRRFRYYPEQVWLYLLACQWARIGQEEPFAGRAGENGDELGSRVIAACLAGDLMRLGFLLERRYAPYSKWFGRAFQQLSIAGELGPALESVLEAEDWQARQSRLARAFEIAAERHNALGITRPLDVKPRNFYGRPFQVIFAERFAKAIREQIQDPLIKKLPFYGGVSQFCTTTDILDSAEALQRLKSLYE